MLDVIIPETVSAEDLRNMLVAQATRLGLRANLIHLESAGDAENDIGTFSVFGTTKAEKVVHEHFTFRRDGMCLRAFGDYKSIVPWNRAVILMMKRLISYLCYIEGISPGQAARAQAELSPIRPTPGSC